MKNQKLFAGIMLSLVTIQGVLDSFNAIPISESVKVWIAGITMLVALLISGFNQFMNPEISNKSLWVSLLLFGGFIAGGVLDKMDVFHLSPQVSGYVRLALTMVTAIVGVLSKTLFTGKLPETKI